MSLLSKIFARENPNLAMRPLYDAIVGEGRRLSWYQQGSVPDTIDGRFDMVVAILSLVLIRLEKEEEAAQASAWLTEIFISDMDGQLRQIGIGDMIVGKHIGKMMSALGGRLGAYRNALKGDTDLDADLRGAIVRNIFRGEAPDDDALGFVAASLEQFYGSLVDISAKNIISGTLPASVD